MREVLVVLVSAGGWIHGWILCRRSAVRAEGDVRELEGAAAKQGRGGGERSAEFLIPPPLSCVSCLLQFPVLTCSIELMQSVKSPDCRLCIYRAAVQPDCLVLPLALRASLKHERRWYSKAQTPLRFRVCSHLLHRPCLRAQFLF